MRLKRSFPLAALAVGLLCTPAARADVKLPALFSDGMVLQRGASCPIWGTADPGEEISWEITDGKFVISSPRMKIVKENGSWRLDLDIPTFQGAPAPAEFKKKCREGGGPFTLTISGKNTVEIKNVMIGEVWIASGQSNMEQKLRDTDGSTKSIADSANPNIRLFTVKRTASATPQSDVPRDGNNGKWLDCGPDTVPDFSAVAYFFARDIQKARNVPVGIIHSSWGGTAAEEWTSMDVLKANPTHLGKHGRQSQLYNGMIAPLIPYAIKGAIWYQGESNASRAAQYAELMGLMIKNWRDDWKQGDFPFFFVQLAPYYAKTAEPTDPDWARLREAQLHTLKVKNTGMAVITDVGDEKDIHPRRKEAVGVRLALAALGVAYEEKIEYSGPIFEKMTVEGDKAVLRFTHLGRGLEVKGEMLTGFTVAGEDKKFYNATATIKGDTVVVSCDQVEKPVAVRFGWANYPVVNLYNLDGLPASPFRTDDWPKAAAVKPKQ